MGNLTAVQVRNLKVPGRYSDGNGLILDIGRAGRGSWAVRVQSGGKRRDIGIGSLADRSLGEARELAAAIRRDMKSGIDVVAERKKEREESPTFRDAARLVHAEHKAAWKNGKHQAQWISVGRLALEFLILTATRSGEVRGATWSELNLENGLWTIPAERMKAGKVHVVPLSPAALSALERAEIFRTELSDFVFPGQSHK